MGIKSDAVQDDGGEAVLVSVHVRMCINVSDVCICVWQPRSFAESVLT